MAEEVMKSSDWKWHVWKMDRKGKRSKWIGFFIDPKSAFEWIKKQKDPSIYRCNNVPPSIGTQNPDRELIAVTATKFVEGEELPKKDRGGSPRKVRPKKTVQPVARVRRPARDNSPEMQEMRRDAADIYQQHKADEAAELEGDDE